MAITKVMAEEQPRVVTAVDSPVAEEAVSLAVKEKEAVVNAAVDVALYRIINGYCF